MKQIIFILLLSALFVACNQENQVDDENAITIGVKDSLYSEIIGEQREIWVHVPASYSGEEKYPVVYLLDGDGHFYSVMGLIKQLSTTNGNSVLPEMIVVGIPNTDRFRDLTPTHVGDSTSTSGGGDDFTLFIRDELMPYIDENYPTSTYKTMIGHSLGGLMAVNTLMNYPDMFDNYIAIDPSMWWDGRKLLNETKPALAERNFDGKSLFIGIANTMAKGMDTTKVVTDTLRNTNHIRSILELSKTAAANPDNGLKFSWKYYEDEDHGSVPLISEYDALKFIFSWHKFPKWSEVLDAEKTPEELLNLIVSHYQNVSDQIGYEVKPNGRNLHFVASTLKGRGMNEKAYLIFNLNVETYPESAFTNEAMGDYYLGIADTANAISYFEKAVSFESETAREKLEALR